ncbi:nuclear transport factor 2 family protein [Roseisolibacter sp. H3M3-2]|uniref:nuclear transport factor 2 family protein n=1 Tax=Roseisolibacter sp. H3M3-2 TaxID=3031323 RepID=UPI0023D9AAEA|nr:nuclear transport factor 2 family protein [Roseisolibacter sp. H3M3-2]MDF1505885.1 nuclear transport factor 2 family protein [Roseisolibacter sp. H3M3-2]
MPSRRPLPALVGAALALAACAGGPAPRTAPAPASAADTAEARRAAMGFVAAFDSLQWDRFRGYLAGDVTMFFPFAQVPRRADGRAAVEAVFQQFFQGNRAARERAGRPMVQGLVPRDVVFQMLGADASMLSFHLGEQSPARRSIAFRRQGGEWKVAHWHASPAPAAPPAGAPSAASPRP